MVICVDEWVENIISEASCRLKIMTSHKPQIYHTTKTYERLHKLAEQNIRTKNIRTQMVVRFRIYIGKYLVLYIAVSLLINFFLH
jgi:hypothetical protein